MLATIVEDIAALQKRSDQTANDNYSKNSCIHCELFDYIANALGFEHHKNKDVLLSKAWSLSKGMTFYMVFYKCQELLYLLES